MRSEPLRFGRSEIDVNEPVRWLAQDQPDVAGCKADDQIVQRCGIVSQPSKPGFFDRSGIGTGAQPRLR